jgi:hypothetical protein
MSAEKGRYSKVSRRIWNDSKFRELSGPKPCGSWLWFRLLTGPELTCIPGLFQAWEAGLAQALGWALKDFRKAFAEVRKQELAKADWTTGLIWLPNAIRHNEPESPNVVRGWRVAWSELPDCALKTEAAETLRAWCDSKGAAWAEAFAEATGEASSPPSGKPSPKPSKKTRANQEQEQEQEQEQDLQPEGGSQDLSRQREHTQSGSRPPSVGNPDRESPMPADFELHPTAVGDLAKRCKVSEAVIREAEREFRDYWLDGPGAGKARSNWQWKCRKDIEEKHKLGKLQTIAARLSSEAPTEDPQALERARQVKARQQAEREAEHAKAVAELEAKGIAIPVHPAASDVAKLVGGIGG